VSQVELKALPFAEQLTFFRSKGYATQDQRFAWQDMMHEEHGRYFTVAKAMRNDVLADIRQAVDAAIADGLTPRQFQQRLMPVLIEKGWWGRQESTDPLTQETRPVQLGSPRRLQIIYDTNLRVSHAAGRWAQIQRVKDARPWLRYVAILDDRVRPAHRRWHGTVLAVGNAWWHTHYPPNGWRCRCTVQQLSQYDLDRLGFKANERAPGGGTVKWTNPRSGEVLDVPAGVDPGFGYNPGTDYWRSLTPPPQGGPVGTPLIGPPGNPIELPPLPQPRQLPADLIMPEGRPRQDYVDRFLQAFGATADKTLVFTDVKGEPIVISDDLFKRADGSDKAMKFGRALALMMVAETIKRPDEIWSLWASIAGRPPELRRRYLARWTIAGESQSGLAVFEFGKSGWDGVTAFNPERADYLARQRQGVLIYRREGSDDGKK
jgi:SPP1 gp7 family putative phage head morphogenesis protein